MSACVLDSKIKKRLDKQVVCMRLQQDIEEIYGTAVGIHDEMIGFNPAVEIASLKREEQKELPDTMDYAQFTPSLSQTQRMKQLSRERKLTKEKLENIMSEIKKG